MNSNENSLNWFEISVTDLERAKKFYCEIFQFDDMEDMAMDDMKMASFPYEPGNGKANGALAMSPFHKPSMDGAVVYLNGNPDLAMVLERVEAAGGQVIMPKTKISDNIGYMAFFADSEGNRVALHSQN